MFVAEWVHPKFDFRRDAEIAAAAHDRPIETRFEITARLKQPAVSHDDLRAQQVVDRQSKAST